jgi:8-amino-7-oxononanoate synthase
VATTHEALRQLQKRPELRESIWRNANHLYDGLQAANFEVGPEVSPVVAVRLGEKEKAVGFWNRLLEAGIYTNLMIPPASPDRHSYLRCSVSAAHTPEQIDRIIAAFSKVAAQL